MTNVDQCVPPSQEPEAFPSILLARSSSSPCSLHIPPPPWRAFQPQRSTSMVKRQCKPSEDPFLAAIKVCTKNSALPIVEGRKRSGLISFIKRGKTMFLCKNGCEIREDGLVKLSQLLSIPRENVN